MLNLLEILLSDKTIVHVSQPEAFFSSDLTEKALRKLAGQAFRNEINVTDAWLSSLPVRPPKA